MNAPRCHPRGLSAALIVAHSRKYTQNRIKHNIFSVLLNEFELGKQNSEREWCVVSSVGMQECIAGTDRLCASVKIWGHYSSSFSHIHHELTFTEMTEKAAETLLMCISVCIYFVHFVGVCLWSRNRCAWDVNCKLFVVPHNWTRTRRCCIGRKKEDTIQFTDLIIAYNIIIARMFGQFVSISFCVIVPSVRHTSCYVSDANCSLWTEKK